MLRIFGLERERERERKRERERNNRISEKLYITKNTILMRMQLWRIIWATHVEWFDKLKKLYKILIKHRKEEIIWKAQLYIG